MKNKFTNYESYEICIYYKLNEYFTNEKIQSYYIECISKEIRKLILVKQHVQWNKVEYSVEINEHIRFWIYNDIYNK